MKTIHINSNISVYITIQIYGTIYLHKHLWMSNYAMATSAKFEIEKINQRILPCLIKDENQGANYKRQQKVRKM